MLTIEVNAEAAAAALGRVGGALANARPLLAACGKRLEKSLRTHFLARDREGNKRGWPSRHFWNRTVRANTALATVTAEQATVAIAAPEFAQKLFGGTIRPKRGKALAIPLTAQAYAAGSPREGGIQGLFRPRGRRFLAVRDAGGALRVQYLLVSQVTQAADPRALPPEQQMDDEIRAEADAWVARQVRSAQG